MSDNFASKEEQNLIFNRLKQHPDNNVCFDCSNRNPTWTSIPFGVLLCLECSSVHRNLGVHISFVKSSNLDSWQRIQLRNFKFGGNHAAKEYFRKNGGSQFLTNGDANVKYTSNVAKKYKEKLKQRANEDAIKHPDEVVLEDATDELEESSGPESDFFTNFSKPIANTPSPLGSTDDLSKTNSNGSGNGNGSTIGNKKPIGRSRISRLNQNNQGKKSSILNNKGPSNSRIRAKKIEKEEIDFDELEKKAKAEEEEAKKLGYKPEPIEPIEKEKPKPNYLNNNNSNNNSNNGSSLSLGNDIRDSKEKLAAPIKDTTQQFQKLGFGMVDGDNNTSSNNKKNYKEVKYTGEVSNKFGTQKGISSDEFFGRGPRFDENSKREAQSKLQSFEGAQSISSSSYFGEDEQPQRARTASGGLSGLEGSAREFASKFSGNANQDLEVLKDALEDGATKVGSFLRDFLR